MPVKWTVKKYLEKHGVSSYRFQQDTGLSSSVGYSIAKDEHETVDKGVLDKVVPYLRKLTGDNTLQIGDVVKYQTDAEHQAEESAKAARDLEALIEEHGADWVRRQLEKES